MANRVINAHEVYYRKNGKKLSKLLNSVREVNAFKRNLARNKRKFLGNRPVQLVEVA
jgi:hypothetical protein